MAQSNNSYKRAELALQFVLVCVAVFGIAQYLLEIARDRDLNARSQALLRIAQIDDARVDMARKKLFDFWTDHADAVAVFRSTSVSPNSYKNFLVQSFDAAENSEDLYAAVYRISSLYDDVYFCLDSRLCDRAMIKRYYCPRARTTLDSYAPIIDVMKYRSGYSTFGFGLERLYLECGNWNARSELDQNHKNN